MHLKLHKSHSLGEKKAWSSDNIECCVLNAKL